MIRGFACSLALLALVACRSYDVGPRISSQHGLIPPDQFARYGKEQAEAIAIAREFGRSGRPGSAMTFARSLPDVADIGADSLGRRLTIQFKSGWRVGVPPVADGKSGAETLNTK